MAGNLVRRARRACAAGAVLSLLLAFAPLLADAAEEDNVPRPEVFRGAASAQAISVQADREALLPVPELFRFIALDGSGIYESSTRQARASLLFPGNGLILGPNLACGTFGREFPEQFKPILDACLQYKYPLTVFADDFAPDGATSGTLAFGAPGDPISGDAVGARAHAGEDAAWTDAVMQDLRVLGLPALGPITPQISDFEMDTSLFTVESATSRTNQRIVKGVLVVDATTTLEGVRMIGGLIRIGSLRSESHVTDDAKGKRTAIATLEMSGVTVGGVPAQITDKGLVVGSPNGGDGPLAQAEQSQLNELLRSFNVKVTILGSEQQTNKNGSAVASVGGVLIEFGHDVQGLPTIPGPVGELDPNGMYVGSIQLGSTGVLGSATTFGLDPVTLDESLIPDLDDFGSIGPSFVGDDGFAIDVSPGPSGGSALPSSRPSVAARPQLARSAGDGFDDRLAFLYLAMVLAVLALCIAPRLAVPARLPGRRS